MRADAPRINKAEVDAAERLDGKFVVHSNDVSFRQACVTSDAVG
jgi:hypothetical protein